MTVDTQISAYIKQQKSDSQNSQLAHDSPVDDAQSESEESSPADNQDESISSTKLNGNFSVLQHILETGEIVSPVNDSFPIAELLNQENFISLLSYLGLLTFAGTRDGDPLLKIPNHTVKDLMYGYFRAGLEDVDIFKLDTSKMFTLLRNMAYHGQWRVFFDYINSEIQKQASVRDHLNGEKVFQGFLIAYLNMTHHFFTRSEHEFNGGFVDLYLEPFVARFPDMKYGYLIELKYLSEKEASSKKGPEKLQKKIDEAHSQLIRYANDERLQKYAEQIAFKKVVLVYKGWQLAYAEELG